MTEIFRDALEQVVDSTDYGARAVQRIEPPALQSGSNAAYKDDAFRRALASLSDLDCEASLDGESIDGFIRFFAILYGTGGGYRHMYSDVCSVMYGHMGEGGRLDLGSVPDRVQSLVRNVAIISQEIQKEERPSVAAGMEVAGDSWQAVLNGVLKLYDHVELERVRMEYAVKQNESLKGAADDAKASAKKAKKAASEIAEESSEARERFAGMLDDSKRDYITILGIFAAIVITFTAGSAFSASVFQNIAQASIYRLSLVILLLGLVLFDLVSVLLVFILKVSKLGGGDSFASIVKIGNGVIVAVIAAVCAARFCCGG